ncbi:hypothetical protein PG984_009519 [Apiospora sp. TS-2023a]
MELGKRAFTRSGIDIGDPFAVLRLEVVVGIPVVLDVVIGTDFSTKFGTRSWCQVVDASESPRKLEETLDLSKRKELGEQGLREVDLLHQMTSFRIVVREWSRKRGVDISLFLMVRHIFPDSSGTEEGGKQGWAALTDANIAPQRTHDSGLGDSLPGTGRPSSLTCSPSSTFSSKDGRKSSSHLPQSHSDRSAATDSQLSLASLEDASGIKSSLGSTEGDESTAQTQAKDRSYDMAPLFDKDKETSNHHADPDHIEEHLRAAVNRTVGYLEEPFVYDTVDSSLYGIYCGELDREIRQINPKKTVPNHILQYRQAAYMAADVIANAVNQNGPSISRRAIFTEFAKAKQYLDDAVVERAPHNCNWLTGWPPSSWAVLGGHQEALGVLFEYDVRKGRLLAKQHTAVEEQHVVTPMHLAVLLQKEDMIDYLLSMVLSRGLEADTRLENPYVSTDLFGRASRFGDFPIHLAAASVRDEGFWKRMLSSGKLGPPQSNVLGERPLHRAAAMNNQIATEAMLYQSPRADEEVLKLDMKNRSVLWHAAVESKHIVRLLIKAGAPLDVADQRGYAPIHVAVMKRNVAGLQVLVQEGANINQPIDDQFALLPIHLAILLNSFACLEILVEAKSCLSYESLTFLPFDALYMAIANQDMAMAWVIWRQYTSALDDDWHVSCIVKRERGNLVFPIRSMLCWICIDKFKMEHVLTNAPSEWNWDDIAHIMEFHSGDDSLGEPTFKQKRPRSSRWSGFSALWAGS